VLDRIVREAARRFGDAPAFVAADDWPVSYRQLDRLSDETAVGLARRGLSEGDVLALVLPSTPDYVVAYLAAAKVGAITTGVNPRLTANERRRILERADARLVLATRDLVDGVPDTTETVVVERASAPEGILTELREQGSLDDLAALADDPDRPIAIVWTSGTTGDPKGAVFTGRQLAAIVERDIAGKWGTGGAMLASTQFAHIGFMTKLPWYLMSGGTTYLLDRWRAGDALRLVATHHMRSVGGVAPQVALMLRVPDFDTYDFSSVEHIIMGGGPSSPALVEEARRRFGASYSIRYSSTESGGIGTATAFDADDEEALFTVGRPRPGVEIEIRDEADRPVAQGGVGEIVLRSPTMMTGYWHDPAATAKALAGGWLHTGDLGYLDDRGLLRLAGRRKEMYVRGGYNVYPMEVESVLASHPKVRDIAVVPRADPTMGEIGIAVVVPRTADAPTLDELRDFGREHLASHKLPEALRLVDALPLTPMQKVDRRALAAEEADTNAGEPQPRG
jgi:acyl-CoA synthetase (AMP-forming)/AMP-acid ligase II